ncbi:hypothetical protein MLD38_031860 [Melastoma candidum]|uniref:Uncharacterized protein n=1 Tax=Melastoma candidum TaxID=119954 RepID=A0ACB9MQW2_9MYRT|nr:hypothetical protein MLD38_031860 [Melastoma candidum]
MEDEVVWRQYGFELRRSDLEFLKGPCFITDRLIDFYFQGFLSAIGARDISFVPSSVTYWLARSTNARDVADCLYHFNRYPGNLVLFPLNNDRDLDRIDVRPDTHWSLLVFDSFQRAFIHFDSPREESDDYSLELALRIYDNVRVRLERMERMEDNGDEDLGERKPYEFRRVWAADPAKGFNKYDCGLHVIRMAFLICCWYLDERGSIGDHGYEALIQEMEPAEEGTAREMIKDAILDITGEDIMKLLHK